MAINESKLNEFLGKAVGDLGAALSATLVLVGDRLGLYKELAQGAVTSAELAQRTGTNERYVREWLGNQGASGYVQYDAANGKWSMTPEQALCLADPNGPVDVPGAYNIVEATFQALGGNIETFKSGKGMEWGEHHPCLFHGTERFFRAGYNANLVTSWLPALDGVVEKLKRGARVADVGCGHGASTVLMAKTYPKSTFVGYDYHGESIRVARARAAPAGSSGRRRRFGQIPARDRDAVQSRAGGAALRCGVERRINDDEIRQIIRFVGSGARFFGPERRSRAASISPKFRASLAEYATPAAFRGHMFRGKLRNCLGKFWAHGRRHCTHLQIQFMSDDFRRY